MTPEAAAPAAVPAPRPNVWRRWANLIDRRGDATPLAVARIVAGATIAWHLQAMWLSGIGLAVWVDQKFGGIKGVDLNWLDPIGGATPTNVRALMAVGLLVSLMMAAGVFTRVTTVATYVVFRILSGLNDHAGGSSDDLLINGLFLLMLSDCGGALSWDNRGKPPRQVPMWPRYVLIGQLVLVYWTTGLQKVSASWLPVGDLDALWYIFQQPSWHRMDMQWLAPFYKLTQLGTLVTWCFEQAAPLLLLAFWYRDTADRPGRVRALFNRFDFRTLYLCVGLSLHVGIWLTMAVGPFFGGVAVCYAACFTGEEYRAATARVTSALRRRTRSPSVPS